MTKKIKSDEIKRLAERIAKGKKTTITRQQLKEMVIQELGTLAVNDKVISNAMKSLSELLSDDNFRRAAGTQFQTAVQKVLTGLRDMRNAQKHESVRPRISESSADDALRKFAKGNRLGDNQWLIKRGVEMPLATMVRQLQRQDPLGHMSKRDVQDTLQSLVDDGIIDVQDGPPEGTNGIGPSPHKGQWIIFIRGLPKDYYGSKYESASPESERFPKKGDIVQGPGGTGKISRVGDFDVIVDWDWSYEGNAHPQIKINKLQWNGKRWITK